MEGVVHVSVTTDGERVKSAHAKDGPKLLAAAAEDNARTWVQVIKTNYFERPSPDDEEQVAGYPPRDLDGNFYYIEYIMEGSVRSISNCFGSSDEAVQTTMNTLKWPIH
jgi:hypothetical protein